MLNSKFTHPATVKLKNGLIIEPSLLTVTDSNSDYRLSHKEMEMLLLLLKHQGTVLHKQDIIDAIWPDNSYVANRGIIRVIHKLRKVLGDENHEIIKNVPKIGYVLDDSTMTLAPQAVKTRAKSKLHLAALMGMVVVVLIFGAINWPVWSTHPGAVVHLIDAQHSQLDKRFVLALREKLTTEGIPLLSISNCDPVDVAANHCSNTTLHDTNTIQLSINWDGINNQVSFIKLYRGKIESLTLSALQASDDQLSRLMLNTVATLVKL